MAKKKITDFFKKVISKIPKSSPPLFAFFYIIGLVSGLIMLSFYYFFPSLVVCASLFGEHFCTPLGIFWILIISLPGYFIVGNLLPLSLEVNWISSLILVIVASLIFYFLLGILAQKYSKASFSRKIIVIIISFFLILAALFVLFLL